MYSIHGSVHLLSFLLSVNFIFITSFSARSLSHSLRYSSLSMSPPSPSS